MSEETLEINSMEETEDDIMNSKVNRLRTFYINENINSVNKLKFVEKGLYISQETGEIICTKCNMTFSERDNGYISEMVRHTCEGMLEDIDEWKSPYCDNNFQDNGDESNDLNFDEYRLTTFNFWPHKHLQDTSRLASYGFLYHMGDDTIKCFFCGFSLSKTNQGADPQRAHSTFRPTCEQSKKKREDLVMKILKRKHLPTIIVHDDVVPAASFAINPDTAIDVFMTSRLIKDVINIGYTADIIKEIVARRYHEIGSINFTNRDEIIEEILKSDLTNSSHSSQPDILRMLKDKMESQMALNAIQLGFSINTIRVVLLEKIQLGLDFTTGDDLIEVLTEHKTAGEWKEKIDKLEKKNRDYEKEKECKICFNGTSSIVFIPCGHILTCVECSASLRKCPICNRDISSKHTIYF